MEKKYHCLYQIINQINGMIYIGMHSTDKLFDRYMGGGAALNKAYKEFGKENFIKYIIGLYDNRYDLCTAELKIVDKEFVLREDTYNMRTGGTGGIYIYTEESKKKMSESTKRYFQNNPMSEEQRKIRSINSTKRNAEQPLSEEARKRISEANTGKKQSEEAKQKNRESHLGKIQSEETKKKRSESMKAIMTDERRAQISENVKNRSKEITQAIGDKNRGKKRTEEQKQKMREVQQNRPPISEETRQKMREAHKNRLPPSEETKKKISEAGKKRWEAQRNVPKVDNEPLPQENISSQEEEITTED